MNEVKITIPGRPVPKGRPRIGYRGRSVILYTPPETENYEKGVARAAKESCLSPATGPVEMEIALYFNPQAKVYTRGGEAPHRNPAGPGQLRQVNRRRAQ